MAESQNSYVTVTWNEYAAPGNESENDNALGEPSKYVPREAAACHQGETYVKEKLCTQSKLFCSAIVG